MPPSIYIRKMDYGLALLFLMVGAGALAGGALITVGVIETVTGRVVVNLQRATWPPREATVLGLARVVQGIVIAAYPLIAGQAIGAHVIPEFWVGHWWGIFISLPFYVVIMGTVFLQATLELRRQQKARAQSRGR